MNHSFPPAPAVPRTSFTATPVRQGTLQRKCACGGAVGLTGECEECRKRRLLQRSAVPGAAAGRVPSVVHQTLAKPGEAVEARTQRRMEAHFGHSFADVRVHRDGMAGESARAVQADAYTVGRHIVFASGKYAPGTRQGQRLIAHELAHVLQQRAGGSAPSGDLEIAPAGSREEVEAEETAARVFAPRPAGRAPLSLQRQAAGEDEKREPERQPPAVPAGSPRMTLELDPEIQAQMDDSTRTLLDPVFIRASLLRMNFDSILAAPPPPWLTLRVPPAAPPLVPRGAGPSTPGPASVGMLVQALLKVPAIDGALTTLQTQALGRMRSEWSSLSSGGKAVVLTQSALLGGGALAGVLSSPDARQFTLDLLQDRALPTGIPGLQFQFNLTGDRRVQFMLNVGQFLPVQWGFR